LTAEDDDFELEAHAEPIAEEDWHELARMLPDRPLEEEDINILGRRDMTLITTGPLMLGGIPMMAFSTATTGSNAKR